MTIQPHDAPVHPAMNPEVDESLARARASASVDREAALLFAEQAHLSDLLAAATEIRAAGKGNVVSFSKKVFIPLTTLCRDYCSYCTFRKDPGQPGAHFMTPDEVLALAEQARKQAARKLSSASAINPNGSFPRPANS